MHWWSLLLILLIKFRGSSASTIEPNDADFLRKQEVIFQLLWSTKDRPKNHPEVYERIKNYRIEDVAAACENQTSAKNLENYRKSYPGLVFSELLDDDHAEEAKILASVFLSAKSFDDFVALAAWSRLTMSSDELAWLHGFSVALAHRPDSSHLRVPCLHEILPHYFFNTDVLLRAYRIKTGEVAGPNTLDANYTAQYPAQDEEGGGEYELSYFREDVGLNEFYFQFTTSCPFWMNAEECQLPKAIRGEFHLHVHRQLLSRYKLERLSWELADLEDIDWEQPIATGFYPTMSHANGLQFPVRPTQARLPAFKYKFLEEVKHYESRVSRAADLGELRSARNKAYHEASFNDFGNVLEGNADSLHQKFYGSLERSYRRLLGFAPEAGVPSALEMSLTSLRDPGFYRLLKKIDGHAYRFKRNNLPAYAREDLMFEGVRLDYVHVERLCSRFQAFESSLNHLRLLDLDEGAREVTYVPPVKARQMRLAHKPFPYQIGLSSESPVKAIVRVFLGPARDRHGRRRIELKVRDFVELDRWIVELKQGNNKLERSSADSIYGTIEPRASEAYWRSLTLALKTSDESLVRELLLAQRRQRKALPSRLLLPRGTKAGLPLRLLVCIHPVQQSSVQQLPENAIFGGMPLDGRSLGFPLDRPWEQSLGSLEALRNFMVKEVLVYHEEGNEDVDKD